jgi:hypothetical protein
MTRIVFSKRLTYSKLPLLSLLIVNALMLVGPKLALIQFTNKNLWGEITKANLIIVIAQDLLVALAVFVLTFALLRNPGRLRVLTAALGSGFFLMLLMIDMRARQLWLKPLDLSMVCYVLHNARGLKSGLYFFFKNYASVYSLSFERFLFYVSVVYACIWVLIVWCVSSSKGITEVRWTGLKTFIVIAATVALLGLSFSASRYRYRLNENVLLGGFISEIKSLIVEPDYKTESLAASFEQKPSPLNLQLRIDREILEGVKPFRNIIFVVYESMRWRDLNIIGEAPTLAPTLSGLAASGIVSKCYAAVPHSAKAYYTLFTGRYPYPGIEMREVLRETNDTILHYLQNSTHTKSYAISSQNLAFESMGTLLKSFGMDPYEIRDLPESKDMELETKSSFGMSDESLYPLGSQFISKVNGAFVAVFFPLAAHYPYDCKGSDTTRHSVTDYRLCVSESDTNLANFLATLKGLGLLKDTLIVIVGDHGESFGEHGTYVHNSSMYDEEVAVPLVFWSEDGRLGHHVLPYSRQIDIMPTIADLMGAMNATVAVQGVSLLRQRNSQPDFMATFFDDLGAALVEPPFTYIYEQSSGKLLAFDNEHDPLEESPLSLSSERQQAVIQRIRAFLAYQKQAF